MDIVVTKNPFSIYRGTKISDGWYFKMKNYSEDIQKVISQLDNLEIIIEQEKEIIVSQIEKEFFVTKDKNLLNFKRDVYNLRDIRLQKYSGPICLNNLLVLLNEQKALNTTLTHKYIEVVQKSREVLQQELSNEDLKKTFIFFNKNIYPKVDKYLSQSIEKHNKKDKKLDNFIINLLIRSSMKTSPFSYLTRTGSTGNKFLAKNESNVEFNHALLFRIFLEKIRTDIEALKVIPVQVSKFGQRANKIFFVTQENVPQSRKIYETRDKLVEMKLDAKLIAYLHKHQEQTIEYKDFEQFLKENSLYTHSEMIVYSKLVSLKILVQKIKISNNRGLIDSMIMYLRDNNICQSLINDLQLMGEKQVEFSTADVEKRLCIWQELENIINHLSEDIPDFGTEILYEDILFESGNNNDIKDIENKFSLNFFQDIVSLLLLFDVNIRVQYEIAALYKEKYEDEKTNLSDSTLLNKVFFEKLRYFYPYFQDMDYRYTEAISPEVKLLDDLRDEFKSFFVAYIDQNDESEIDLKKIIHPFSERIPEYIKQGNEFSMTFFYQIYQDKVILNDIYDGQEKFLSRFKDFFEKLECNDEYKAYIKKNYYDKNYYEVNELFGFNGGIHNRIYNQKLNLNLGNQRFSDDDHPAISDFFVTYDTESKKLNFLDHNGEKARIAYKSSLVPVFLPGILSVILLMFQSGRINFDINYFLKTRKEVPRINLDNIVMYRRKWNLSLDELTAVKKTSKNEVSLYTNVNKYFREKRLPDEFFLKKYRSGGELSPTKPIFIDIKVPLLLKHFLHEINGKESIDPLYYIEEVLPEFENDLKEYVVEYTIDN